MNQQVEVVFDGKKFVAWLAAQPETSRVALKPICDILGIGWSPQLRKLLDGQNQFNCDHMIMVGADGKHREMVTLPIVQLSTWLGTISAKKVDERSRAGLIRFQQQLQMVLYNALVGRTDKQLIEMMAQEISFLKSLLIKQGEQISELQGGFRTLLSRADAADQVAFAEASGAGKRLYAQRHLKLVQQQLMN
jgi:hypothetical protein